MNKEIVKLGYDEILELWDNIYYENSSYTLNNITYKK